MNNSINLAGYHIKTELLAHLQTMGFSLNRENPNPPCQNKDILRSLHYAQRQERLRKEQDFINKTWTKLSKYFADGREISPDRISPRVELIEGTEWKRELFRLATLGWSVPVSNGYGRRMRFLIWDDYNGKLIGIMALGDPVFNLKVRDDLIGWGVQERKERLVHVMDAYVLGAVPPYNYILGGKLVACLIRTREVVETFSLRYGDKCGIISKKNKNAKLVLVTTTSALGRSSVYNRLKLGGQSYLEPIGYTQGWGHFHISDHIFNLMREYLDSIGDNYAQSYTYGNGPNWRIRVIKRCIYRLGLDPNILKHGIKRQVFACRLATNAFEFLAGIDDTPIYDSLLSVEEVSELARERWLIPRSCRRPEYLGWNKEHFLDSVVIDDKAGQLAGA